MANKATTTTNNTTTQNNEAPKAIRNFKHNSDIENFYRFVHENGLRREASIILGKVHSFINGAKKKKARKSKKKIQ